ncbi:monocarboxylate transporter 14 [Clonorchis sinensis]|uniref:Monocarboxylate transporter 14 n=1 Tax=Clonorchis sinensis TaxID=79923 RepID=G7YJG7_CLOSI|nr:monocarboxylate transporter 14 [Clonorchis sinensis]
MLVRQAVRLLANRVRDGILGRSGAYLRAAVCFGAGFRLELLTAIIRRPLISAGLVSEKNKMNSLLGRSVLNTYLLHAGCHGGDPCRHLTLCTSFDIKGPLDLSDRVAQQCCLVRSGMLENFGLALGLTMCGSGVGSFAFNPFVAWLLESWTWREVLFIEGAILLNSMVSASCFHHLDAIRFPIAVKKSALGLYQTIGGERLTQSSVMVGEAHTTGAAPRSVEIPDEETAVLAANSIEDIRGNMANEQSGCADFLTAFMVSLKQLGSRSLWKNPTYVVYIFANGLAGAAIVIPWTFIYDHGILSLSDENGNLDETNMSSVSLLPSLIGMGSLIGQVAFGLITSQLGQLRAPLCSCWLTQRNNFGEQPPSILPEGRNPFLGFLRCSWSDKSSCHLLLFMIVLLWSSLSTLLISLLPLSTLASHISAHVSFLSLPIGRAMAAACLLVGISYGGFYVLYPQILIDTLGENLWPAGLGVFLFVNGAMNLIGTTIGGRLFDTYNSYKPAFLLASLILFVSLTVVVVQQTVHFLLRRRLSAH